MVRRERRPLIARVSDGGLGWRELAGGSWLFEGQRFADERGFSNETYDLTASPALIDFSVAQENLITTFEAGCARGLHYQAGQFAQAKIVTVVAGSAQFLWLALDQAHSIATVHSIVLDSPAQSLYTPDACAHGFLALEDDTVFLLRTSRSVSLSHRREIRLLSDRLVVPFERPIREDLLSHRDRNAKHWSVQG
jgi:dTDP-4-dehydrorhamnose 3,5-epimerase